MKSYHVALIKTVSLVPHEVLVVEAETEDEAGEKAKQFAKSNELEWVETLSTKQNGGDIIVYSVETIVDLEQAD